MFKSLFGLATDVVKIATAPIGLSSEIMRGVTKPVAEVVDDLVEDIKGEDNAD